MAKHLSYELKEKLTEIGGTCFWYWGTYQAFFESCGVRRTLFLKHREAASNKYNVMRQILTELEQSGNMGTILTIQSTLYNLKKIPDDNVPDPKKAKRVLQELRELCGEDLLDQKIKEKQQEEKRKQREQEINSKLSREKRLEQIKNKFYELCQSDKKQKRGYQLEVLLYDLFALFEIEYQNSFKSDTDQIDGYFIYDKFDYLLEAKWEKEPVDKGDLSEFNDSINRRIQSTRGLFVSMRNFNPNHIKLFEGNNPSIILMDGEDSTLILEGHVSLHDALDAKINHAVKHGKIFFNLRNL